MSQKKLERLRTFHWSRGLVRGKLPNVRNTQGLAWTHSACTWHTRGTAGK